MAMNMLMNTFTVLFGLAAMPLASPCALDDGDGCVTRPYESTGSPPGWLLHCQKDTNCSTRCSSAKVDTSYGSGTGLVCVCENVVGVWPNCCRIAYVPSVPICVGIGVCGQSICDSGTTCAVTFVIVDGGAELWYAYCS
jgi:hypothetical protein